MTVDREVKDDNDRLLANCVRQIREILAENGWIAANSAGELVNGMGRTVWFGSTYTHGEYTVTASIRPRGFGRPEGVVRVRLTPALVTHEPDLPQRLAYELLIDAPADRLEWEWPPRNWERLAR